MKLLNTIRNLFAPSSIAATIKSEVALELTKIRQTEEMIEQLEFHKALSIARVTAMLNWEKENLLTITKERTEHDDHSSY